jgi:hypothetical protein
MTSQPLIELKMEFTQKESFIPGMPFYHMAIRIHNIRKLIAISKSYCYYKKLFGLPVGITLMKEILYERNPNDETHHIIPKIPESLYRDITKLAEIMKQTPLPFPYVKNNPLFPDVIFHLVSDEVVEKRGCCGCSFFSPFSYTIRNKDSLKECLVDMANCIYQINSSAVLILPKKYYRKNSNDEQTHFQRMTDIGLKEHLLAHYPISDDERME